MEVFRLSLRKYAKPLSGRGAAIRGARWNSQGVELIYSASNRSLAMAEVAVHMTFIDVPDDFVMVTIRMPNDISIQKLTESDLPRNWNALPYRASTQKIGDKFVAANKCCALQVPSAVTQGDFNFLLNPQHAEFAGIKIIKIERFPFDARLFR